MKIYFDTEFTDLHGVARDPGLISIGFVSDTGQEFYAELTDTWDEGICSLFVINEVLPQLQYRLCKDGVMPDFVMGIDDLASKLKGWIQSFDKPVTLMSDAPNYDWVWIALIFDHHEWPSNLIRKCKNALTFETDKERFRYNNAMADYWRSEKNKGAVQHHALWDARSIRFAHRYAVRKRL
jgi:hypothetical protein